jgi:4-amino-4-deoxy-L-arabinose transferase-like glycosyltransferase
LFFSIPPSKLAGYILPATPPLAIYLAMVLHNIFNTSTTAVFYPERLKNWSGLVLVSFIAITLMVVPYLPKAAHQLASNELIELFALALVLIFSVGVIGWKLYQNKMTAFQVTLLSSLLMCTSITLVVKWLDHKSSDDQMAFASDLTPTMPLVFYHRYYYDIPFMLNRKQPTYWVQDWATVAGDNGAAQIKDGLRFEPQQSYLLWNDSDLDTRIKNGEHMMILVPKQFKIDTLGDLKPIRQERNFDVFITGQQSATVQP